MNLWLRLFWYLVTAWRRPKLGTPQEVSTLPFRVWPTDLDLSLHMNNGRYLTTGLWRPLVKHRWTPIASGIAIRFRRELRVFDRVQMETRLLAWSDVTVVMEQVLRFASGPRAGQVASRALFKGGLYDRKSKAFLPITRLMQEIGVKVEAPAMTADVEAFLKADEAIRASAGMATSS
jgi:acyl-CoA thioesterase FadM